MRGSLILRLVDITLLLLLSLMAAASITTGGAALPESHRLQDKGILPATVTVTITADGAFLAPDDRLLNAGQLTQLLESVGVDVVFVADAKAPAIRLMAAHRAAREADRRAAFVVQHKEWSRP